MMGAFPTALKRMATSGRGVSARSRTGRERARTLGGILLLVLPERVDRALELMAGGGRAPDGGDAGRRGRGPARQVRRAHRRNVERRGHEWSAGEQA
jgi:hypothetical protein